MLPSARAFGHASFLAVREAGHQLAAAVSPHVSCIYLCLHDACHCYQGLKEHAAEAFDCARLDLVPARACSVADQLSTARPYL